MKQNLLIFVTATIISEWGESLVPMGAAPELADAKTSVEKPVSESAGGNAAGQK
jgi:hypothetical protein